MSTRDEEHYANFCRSHGSDPTPELRKRFEASKQRLIAAGLIRVDDDAIATAILDDADLVALQVRAVHDFKELCERSPDRLRTFVGRAVLAISVDASGRFHVLHPFDEDEAFNILAQALESLR